jgi:hypothetical protein
VYPDTKGKRRKRKHKVKGGQEAEFSSLPALPEVIQLTSLWNTQ